MASTAAGQAFFAPRATIEKIVLGGRPATLSTLETCAATRGNGARMRVRLLGYGATVVSLECPDRSGRMDDVVLGFADLGRYLGPHPYFGATVGRFANRIRGARFTLDGRETRLDSNENGHQLHGGADGFHRGWFDATPLPAGRDTFGEWAGIAFTRTSPDGEGGFAGNLDVRVEYRLYDRGALRIDFFAETDRPTIVNLTHHGYWKLAGGAGGVLDESLWIGADRYVPLDSEGIPTGGTRAVDSTAFDFREPRVIGERIGDAELAPRGGYDHPLVVGTPDGGLAHVATLRDSRSGRRLDVHTTEPVLQLYTGQLLDPAETGYEPFAALCLEPGQAPDCPNQPDLGSARLLPGERYEHTVVYTLSVDG